jgi:hypothetical protein
LGQNSLFIEALQFWLNSYFKTHLKIEISKLNRLLNLGALLNRHFFRKKQLFLSAALLGRDKIAA